MNVVRCFRLSDRPHVFPLYAELGRILGRDALGVEWMTLQPWTLQQYSMLVYLVDGVYHGFVDWLWKDEDTIQVLNIYVNPEVKTRLNRLLSMSVRYWRCYGIRKLTALTVLGHEVQWVAQGFTPEYQVLLEKEWR